MPQSKKSIIFSIWDALERINDTEEVKNRQLSSKDQFPLVLLGDWEFKWILDIGKQEKFAEKSCWHFFNKF